MAATRTHPTCVAERRSILTDSTRSESGSRLLTVSAESKPGLPLPRIVWCVSSITDSSRTEFVLLAWNSSGSKTATSRFITTRTTRTASSITDGIDILPGTTPVITSIQGLPHRHPSGRDTPVGLAGCPLDGRVGNRGPTASFLGDVGRSQGVLTNASASCSSARNDSVIGSASRVGRAPPPSLPAAVRRASRGPPPSP